MLNEVCATWGHGDPDPNEEGLFTHVRWKQFAIDFDNIMPTPMPEKKVPPEYDVYREWAKAGPGRRGPL